MVKMSLKNRFDSVIIRNRQPLGLSQCAFDYLLELENRIDSAIDILELGITTYNGGGSRTALFEVISDTLNTLKKEED